MSRNCLTSIIWILRKFPVSLYYRQNCNCNEKALENENWPLLKTSVKNCFKKTDVSFFLMQWRILGISNCGLIIGSVQNYSIFTHMQTGGLDCEVHVLSLSSHCYFVFFSKKDTCVNMVQWSKNISPQCTSFILLACSIQRDSAQGDSSIKKKYYHWNSVSKAFLF